MNIDWSKVKDLKIDNKAVKKLELDGSVVWEKVKYYNFLRNTSQTKIDTGISANDNTRLEFKLWSNNTQSFYALGTRQSNNGSHLFSLTGSLNDQSVLIGVGFTTKRLDVLIRTSSGYTYEGWYQTNGDMTFSYYLNDGTTEYSDSNISYETSLADNDKNIYLFSNGYNHITPTLRIYYLKIYQNGVLVRDFRPAKTNGEIGLYDEVTQTLFTASNTALG